MKTPSVSQSQTRILNGRQALNNTLCYLLFLNLLRGKQKLFDNLYSIHGKEIKVIYCHHRKSATLRNPRSCRDLCDGKYGHYPEKVRASGRGCHMSKSLREL
jgi:hypothetical protein